VFSVFVLIDGVIQEDGAGPAVEVGASAGKSLKLTLGITRIIEQESLDLSIWGSADGTEWGAKPLAAFPQKFYCGEYSLPLDLSLHPEVKFLKAQWKVSRWGRGAPDPLFDICVLIEESSREVAAVTAG
jgi:hypothetical protein